MWKIIEKTGNLKLAVWFLTGAAFSFLGGSMTANANFSFFRSLNSMTIQSWLSSLNPNDYILLWWMAPLFIFLLLLGINTSACILLRLRTLLPLYRTMPMKSFSIIIAPSLIHILFVGILLGHAVTMVMGEWKNVPIKKGDRVDLPDKSGSFTIDDIKFANYPQSSALAKQFKEIRLSITGPAGENHILEMPGYVKFNDWRVLIMMDKKIKKDNIVTTCDDSALFRKKAQEKRAQLKVRMVKDPGLPMISTFFFMILFLLLWYYLGGKTLSNHE